MGVIATSRDGEPFFYLVVQNVSVQSSHAITSGMLLSPQTKSMPFYIIHKHDVYKS